MNNSTNKKAGRRITGSHGRLGTKKLKRAANKGTRKKHKLATRLRTYKKEEPTT